MSNVTPNLGLQKPLENEYYDINVQNSNMDKIDAAVGNIKVPDASLTQKGIVQLSSTTTSTSEMMAATPKAVKAAYDEAMAAKQAGNDRKAEVVAALVAKGVAASTSDTWSQLISKMTAIIVASGDATPSDLIVGRSASNRNGAFNGAMPNRSNEAVHMPAIGGTVWAGDRIFLQPPNGYYNGSTWVTMPATDVRPEFILQGKKVLDMVGTLSLGLKRASGSGAQNVVEIVNLDFEPLVIMANVRGSFYYNDGGAGNSNKSASINGQMYFIKGVNKNSQLKASVSTGRDGTTDISIDPTISWYTNGFRLNITNWSSYENRTAVIEDWYAVGV